MFNISLTNNRGDNISSFMLRIIVVISFRKDSFVFLRPNSTIRDIRKADIYLEGILNSAKEYYKKKKKIVQDGENHL